MPIQKTNDIANRSGVAIVILEPLFQHRNLDKGLLADAFNLTDAECAVAERLYIGETIREIAEYRNVATSTVKTMLKSIMSKTDSRRQAEVVTKLSRLAFPAGR
jgi:DNA-binding NarL/FixJ family response regulator